MKFLINRILFSSLLLLGSGLVHAYTVSDRQEIDLDSSISLYITNDSLDIEQSLQSRFINLFAPYKKPTFQFGYTSQWHWMTFSVQNKASETKRFFLVTQSSFLYYYDFFLVDPSNNRIMKRVRTGIARPFVSRDVKSRHFVFTFQVPSNTSYQVYTRVRNYAGNLIQPMRLFTEKGYQEFQPSNNFLISGVLVLLLLGIVISVFLLLSFFERIYYFYTCYLLSIFWYFASYEGFTIQYLWPNSLFLVELSQMFYLPSIIYMFYFVHKILSSESGRLLGIKKIGNYLIIIILCLSIVCTLPGQFFPQRNQVTILMNFFVLVLFLLTITALLIKVRQRYKPAYLLSFAFMPGILYGIMMIANYWGVLSINKNTYWVQYGLCFSILLEMCILLWMLLFRFKNIQRLQKLSTERMLLYKKITSKNEKPLEEEKENISYVNSRYDKTEIEDLCTKIKILMEKQRPYLNEALNLQKLANILECPPHMLSQCINQLEGRNFNDFINHYRLREAMIMLTDGKHNGFSVEGIGLEAGFSSKTTFYTAFKKHTGTTPTEFRKTVRIDNLSSPLL